MGGEAGGAAGEPWAGRGRAGPRATVAGRAAIVALVAILVAASLWLPAGLPLVALGDFVHDDALYVKLGGHLARAQWLGPYDESTLAKGPGFPLFVALAYRAHLPLLFAGRLLFVASSGLFVLALLPLFRHRGVPLVLFAALLFNPVVVTRAAREIVYPSLTLLAMAGAAGLFLAFPASRSRAVAWSALSGLALGALWLTREEGIWILPAVGSLLAATVLRTVIARGTRRQLGEAVGLVVLPAGLLGASLMAVALVNYRVYGAFTVRESTSAPFLSAYGALARIRSRAPIPRVPVPREVRLRAYAQSPAFRSLEPLLEGGVGRGFVTASEQLIPEAKGEIAGGWLQFALRESAANTGRYRDARTAAAFWTQVARELDDACDRGRLPCGPNSRSMTPADATAELPAVLADLPRTLAFLVSSVDSAAALRDAAWSRGSKESRVVFARTTRERMAPAADDPRWFCIKGWAFQRGGAPVAWRVLGPDGAPVPYGLRRQASGDVAAALGAPEAGYARVELLASCPGPCLVELVDSGRRLVAFDAISPGERLGSPPPALEMNIDAVQVVPRPSGPGEYERNERRMAALKGIAAAYRRVLTPGLPAAVALFVLAAGAAAARRRSEPGVVVAGALLAGFVSRVALLDLVDRTSFPALHYLYLTPAYPFLYAFVVVAFVSAAGALRRVPAVERAFAYLWAKAATFGFTRRSKSA
ncbi:MAG: hypothetical protein IPN83_15765 [Holophagales bacterium]|nr:hypothetical protein [Holophagales bacterium]